MGGILLISQKSETFEIVGKTQRGRFLVKMKGVKFIFANVEKDPQIHF